MLCGPCLRNRYSQNIDDVLKNPKWVCPYCLGECNCSFCMRKRGLSATGTPLRCVVPCECFLYGVYRVLGCWQLPSAL